MADDDIRAIRQVLARFVEAWNARDADAFANLYTEPHLDLNHAPPVETRAATVAALCERFAHPTPRLSVTSDEVLVFGDWAVQG
ncbi:MAG TPA: nuclear transport factor 2 family protein, partial [Candidatus Dormibacteraeota bacterium]|nr:nuclear transport factor 2 family protein [Candidatus Dormibacteraeota bacterium]